MIFTKGFARRALLEIAEHYATCGDDDGKRCSVEEANAVATLLGVVEAESANVHHLDIQREAAATNASLLLLTELMQLKLKQLTKEVWDTFRARNGRAFFVYDDLYALPTEPTLPPLDDCVEHGVIIKIPELPPMGPPPPNFPKTLRDLNNLYPDNVEALLEHYGIQKEEEDHCAVELEAEKTKLSLADKRKAKLCAFIGSTDV